MYPMQSVSRFCFNPRVREGRDARSRMGHGGAVVSIHASVKDATKEDYKVFIKVIVSIHASVKDATGGLRTIEAVRAFQSTRP